MCLKFENFSGQVIILLRFLATKRFEFAKVPMEIEDSATFDLLDDGFVIDPVEIILPSTAGTTPLKKHARSASKSKRKPSISSHDDKLRDFSIRLNEILQETKNKVLNEKLFKLSTKIWKHVIEEKDKINPFTILKIGMPSNYETLLQSLYSSFDNHQPSVSFGASLTTISINQLNPNIRDLINISIVELEESQEEFREAQKSNKDNKQHIIMLFFTGHFGLYQEFLDDYMKYLTEEFLKEQTDVKIFMVFPSLTADSKLQSLEAEIIDLKLSNTRKMFIKILVDLISEGTFLPFLDSKAIELLIHDLNYMDISLERILQKLHLIVQDYLFTVKESKFLEQLIVVIENIIYSKELETNTFVILKKELLDALKIFQTIEEDIFNIKGKYGEKIINFFMNQEIVYQIPSSVATKIDSCDQLIKMCEIIEEVIAATRNDSFKYYIQKFAQLRSPEDGALSKSKKSKNRLDRRQELLLSKGKASSKENEEKENIAIMKDAISNCLRMFLKECLLGPFQKIVEKFSTLVYKGGQRLVEVSYTDMLDAICRNFQEIRKEQPRKEMPIMFKIVQDFSFRIDTAQSFESFLCIYQKVYPKVSKEEAAKIFFVTLQELKWLGMVNETRKSQISFEKNFFAKALFRKPGTGGDNMENEDEKVDQMLASTKK